MVLRALFLRVSKPVFAKTRLSSDNEAEMRLVDADDAVGAAADILLEHHLLLLVHLEHCPQALVVMTADARQKMDRLFAQEIKKYLEISLQTTYLGQFCLADKFLPLAFFLISKMNARRASIR